MAKYWAEINNSNEVIETTVFQEKLGQVLVILMILAMMLL